MPKDKEGAIKAMGLRETFASKSNNIYYDPKTKKHYQWNKETNKFDAMDKDAAMVGKDGTWFDNKGKQGNYQLLTDGREVWTAKDGSTEITTYDDNGNAIKDVTKDKNGNLLSITNYSYSADGKLTSAKLITYTEDKKVKFVEDFSYENGHRKSSLMREYTADGNLVGIYKFTNGKKGAYIGQEVDASGNPIGEPWYKNSNNEEITKEEYDKLQE